QAEDGIRDWSVTGVQTCALPIFERLPELPLHITRLADRGWRQTDEHNVASPDRAFDCLMPILARKDVAFVEPWHESMVRQPGVKFPNLMFIVRSVAKKNANRPRPDRDRKSTRLNSSH